MRAEPNAKKRQTKETQPFPYLRIHADACTVGKQRVRGRDVSQALTTLIVHYKELASSAFEKSEKYLDKNRELLAQDANNQANIMAQRKTYE